MTIYDLNTNNSGGITPGTSPGPGQPIVWDSSNTKFLISQVIYRVNDIINHYDERVTISGAATFDTIIINIEATAGKNPRFDIAGLD